MNLSYVFEVYFNSIPLTIRLTIPPSHIHKVRVPLSPDEPPVRLTTTRVSNAHLTSEALAEAMLECSSYACHIGVPKSSGNALRAFRIM